MLKAYILALSPRLKSRTVRIHLSIDRANMFARALLFSVLAVRALTRTASSSSSSSVPTETLLNLFIPPGFLGSGFVGSVIQADLCATTYGIACTSGFKNAKTTWFCNPSSTVRHRASWSVSSCRTNRLIRYMPPTHPAAMVCQHNTQWAKQLQLRYRLAVWTGPARLFAA